MEKRLAISLVACGFLIKYFASKTKPLIAKEDIIMMDTKKGYLVRMSQDSLNIAVIAALNILKPEDRMLVDVDYTVGCYENRDVIWFLRMNPKQKIAIKEACADYIIEIKETK